jgi:hypothetical protein
MRTMPGGPPTLGPSLIVYATVGLVTLITLKLQTGPIALKLGRGFIGLTPRRGLISLLLRRGRRR